MPYKPKVGRITPDGDFTEYSLPTQASEPASITAGPDGNVWVTEFLANQIAQLILDPFPLTATGTSITATAGVPFSAVVASFTDADPIPGPATAYTAVIDWGDGSPLSSGGISDTGGGNFDVSGNYTYAASGSYTITVTVTDNDTSHDIGGSTDTATSTAQVNSPPAGAAGGNSGGDAPFLLMPPPYRPPLSPASKRFPEASSGHVSLGATDAVFQESALPAAERAATLVSSPKLFPAAGPGSVSLGGTDAVFQEAALSAAERAAAVARFTPRPGFARSQRPQPDPMARGEAAVFDILAANSPV